MSKNAQKIIQTLWSYFKMNRPINYITLFKSTSILDSAASFTSKDFSQLAYTYSKLKFDEKDTIQRFSNIFIQKHKAMNKQDLINCAFAFSKFYPNLSINQNKEIWNKIESGLISILHSCTFRELITIIHAFALSESGSLLIWKELQIKLNLVIDCLSVEALSIYIYCLSKSKKGEKESWTIIEKKLQKINFDKLELLSSVCHTLSKEEKYSNKIWKKFEDNFILLKNQMDSKNICFTVCAFARMNIRSENIFEIVEKWIIANIQKCKSKDLSLIIWAFDKVQMGSEEFWKKNIQNFENNKEIEKLGYQDCLNLYHSFINRKFVSEKLLLNIKIKVIQNIKNMFEKDKNIDFIRINSLFVFFINNSKDIEFWTSFGEGFMINYIDRIIYNKNIFDNRIILDNYLDILYLSTFLPIINEELWKKLNELNEILWNNRENFYKNFLFDYLLKLIYFFLKNNEKINFEYKNILKKEIIEIWKGKIKMTNNFTFFLLNIYYFELIQISDINYLKNYIEENIELILVKKLVHKDIHINSKEIIGTNLIKFLDSDEIIVNKKIFLINFLNKNISN